MALILEDSALIFKYLQWWSSNYQIVFFFFLTSLDFDERRGAPLLCAGVTMYAPLKRHGRANLRCAIIGIGGLGHVAV